jgi:F-type H+-transporting ATPase subunit gamma
MANLKEIRTRISSVKSTRQITSAMKMVSAAKLRKAQDKIVKLRPYAGKLHELIAGLSSALVEDESNISYSMETAAEKVVLVVITSNRGLCGAFNSNVIRETTRVIEDVYSSQNNSGNLQLLTIGKKGHDYFRKRGYKIIDDYSHLFDDLTFDTVSKLAGELMDKFLKGEVDRIDIVYNQFRNAATQDLKHERFLPLESDEDENENHEENLNFIFEPNRKEIIEELIPKSLKVQFYKSLLDSYVAEHGARMTAMHMATDNATEMINTLTLDYNKARQAAITNEILEVVSGAEALKG